MKLTLAEKKYFLVYAASKTGVSINPIMLNKYEEMGLLEPGGAITADGITVLDEWLEETVVVAKRISKSSIVNGLRMGAFGLAYIIAFTLIVSGFYAALTPSVSIDSIVNFGALSVCLAMFFVFCGLSIDKRTNSNIT